MFLKYTMLQSSCGYNIRYILLPVTNVLYFHLSILGVRAQCPVPNTAVFCSCHYYYYYYYYYYVVSCQSPFLLTLRLKERWSPPFRLQVSVCSTVRFVCDVPNIDVFCSESIEYFRGMVSKFFLKPLVTLPVAPITTNITIHFIFHIRCISIHKVLRFIYFSVSFWVTFLSAGTAISTSMYVFNYYTWPICHNFSIYVYHLIPCQLRLHVHIHACLYVFVCVCVYICVCVCTIFLSFRCLVVWRVNNRNVQQLSTVSLRTYSSSKRDLLYYYYYYVTQEESKDLQQ